MKVPVWKANRIDQEETLDDDSLVYSWSLCKWTVDPEDLPARYVHDNTPSAMSLATHLNVCMDYAFEQDDFLKMFKKVGARL